MLRYRIKELQLYFFSFVDNGIHLVFPFSWCPDFLSIRAQFPRSAKRYSRVAFQNLGPGRTGSYEMQHNGEGANGRKIS